MRASIALLAAGLALNSSGCWMYAIQYAPAVLQTAVSATAHVVAATQPPAADSPGVIELRKDANGSPEYRELRIDFSPTEARWMPVVDEDTAADGWRPAEHFLEMSFSPPLPSVIADDRTTYLAYAPALAKSADDEEQLREFDRSFGDPIGSFVWNGHTYQYSLPKTLPPLKFD